MGNYIKDLISVVIPVFNVKNYLSATLNSILDQTYQNWELLLVDDGSTDGSLEIVEEFCSFDSRIKLYKRSVQPKGAPSCRNIGLNLAQGEYLIYLDSDDIIAPYCFQQRVEYLKKYNCDFAVFPLVGYYNKLFDAEGMVFGYKPQGDDVFSLLARILPFVVVSNIYRRKALIDKGIFWDTELKSYQDSDYNLQAIKAGLSYEITNLLPDYFYRLSAENSICKKLNKAPNCLSQICFINKQTELYGSNKKYNKALMICAAQVFQNILFSEHCEEMAKEFVKLSLFNNCYFLKKSIRNVVSCSQISKNERFLTLLQIIFTPLFFLRFKICFNVWNKRNIVLYRTLSDIYNETVPDTYKDKISSKL